MQHAAAFLLLRPRTAKRKVTASSLPSSGQQCWGRKPRHMLGWDLAAVPALAPPHHREPCQYRYGTAAPDGRRKRVVPKQNSPWETWSPLLLVQATEARPNQLRGCQCHRMLLNSVWNLGTTDQGQITVIFIYLMPDCWFHDVSLRFSEQASMTALLGSLDHVLFIWHQKDT